MELHKDGVVTIVIITLFPAPRELPGMYLINKWNGR